jgi:polyisoprenoid-binding protein YceI
MTTLYRIDPARSRFTVQAFATGLLSFMGHSPAFAVRDFSGTVAFEGGRVGGMRLDLNVRADSLALTGEFRAADREEIERTMRREVLETADYPQIRYEAVAASSETSSPGRYRVRLDGRLSLHGVTREHPAEAELTVFDDGLRLGGGSVVRLTDYRIRPVTALGGTIRLKDELRGTFDLAALPGES